jgi:hypothetical protein
MNGQQMGELFDPVEMLIHRVQIGSYVIRRRMIVVYQRLAEHVYGLDAF